MLTGYLILGERVSGFGAVGILLIVRGSYFINLPSIKQGFLAPIEAIKKEKGSFASFKGSVYLFYNLGFRKKGIFANRSFMVCLFFAFLFQEFILHW